MLNFSAPRDCGGAPDDRQCLVCATRWDLPVAGGACPWRQRALPASLAQTLLRLLASPDRPGGLTARRLATLTRAPAREVADTLGALARDGLVTHAGLYFWKNN